MKRENTVYIHSRDFLGIVAGVCFKMSPGGIVRNFDKIMGTLVEYTKTTFEVTDNGLLKFFKKDSLRRSVRTWVSETLEKIPEVQDLNLSMEEYLNKVSVNDPNRKSFRFTTLTTPSGDFFDPSDFIDLDALYDNITDEILNVISNQSPHMCFLCGYSVGGEATDSDRCKKCIQNPMCMLTDNYEARRSPKRPKQTICMFNCIPKMLMICCKDCTKEDCEHRCDESPETCQIATYIEGVNYNEWKESGKH